AGVSRLSAHGATCLDAVGVGTSCTVTSCYCVGSLIGSVCWNFWVASRCFLIQFGVGSLSQAPWMLYEFRYRFAPENATMGNGIATTSSPSSAHQYASWSSETVR